MAKKKSLPPWPNGTPSELEWAIFAGFFAGEGCISVKPHLRSNSSRVQITLRVSQRWPLPILWIGSVFGGYVRHGTNNNGKAKYEWRVSSEAEVRRILEGIYPHLIAKGDEAQWALKIQRLPREKALQEAHKFLAERARRRNLYD